MERESETAGAPRRRNQTDSLLSFDCCLGKNDAAEMVRVAVRTFPWSISKRWRNRAPLIRFMFQKYLHECVTRRVRRLAPLSKHGAQPVAFDTQLHCTPEVFQKGGAEEVYERPLQSRLVDEVGALEMPKPTRRTSKCRHSRRRLNPAGLPTQESRNAVQLRGATSNDSVGVVDEGCGTRKLCGLVLQALAGGDHSFPTNSFSPSITKICSASSRFNRLFSFPDP